MTQKAQGTIEYLVIIAIVVVIALVVVGLLLQVMGQGSGIPETASQTAWKSAQPWSLTWSQNQNVLTLAIRNNSYEPLSFNNINIIGNDKNTTVAANVSPGQTVIRTITVTSGSCTAGSKYAYPKSGISIDYNTQTIAGMKQYGNADITGTC